MLCHAGSRTLSVASRQSSVLRRAVALEAAETFNQRRYSSTTRSHNGWASTRRQVAPNLRQRRPIVNGEAVAFHVSDLLKLNSTPHVLSSSSRKEPRKPKTTRTYESDLIVVLDMDECLIHAQFLSNPAAAQVYAHQLRQRRMNNVSAHGHVDSFRFALPDGELVHVNLRPGLRDFLQAVTDRFETHVFTAAVDVYADPLLDTLDPSGTMFAGRWYREHCVYDAKQIAYVKNLCTFPPVLNKNLDRVVLVDNNPLSFLANPSNGILVSSFYNDPTDKTLPAVWDLLQVLDNKKCDVRPHLDEQFGLKKALQVIQANDDAAKNNNNNNINIASKAAAA